jgi:hypothetical protein
MARRAIASNSGIEGPGPFQLDQVDEPDRELSPPLGHLLCLLYYPMAKGRAAVETRP